MRKIILPYKYTIEEAEAKFKGLRLTYAYAKQEGFTFVSREDVEFRTPEGKLIAKLVTNVFDEEEHSKRHVLWSQVKDEPRNRPEIFGLGARQQLLKTDGSLTAFVGVATSLTKATGGLAGMLGWFRYHANRNGLPNCSLTNWTQERADLYRALIPSVVAVDELYKHLLPDEYAQQAQYVNQILPEYKIPGTNWTTVYGISNHPTAIHTDTFDIPEATGVLTTTGDFTGNEFCIPQYGLALNLQPTDILFADVHLWHGNLPKISGNRVAQVYFVRKGMHECGREADAIELNRKSVLS